MYIYLKSTVFLIKYNYVVKSSFFRCWYAYKINGKNEILIIQQISRIIDYMLIDICDVFHYLPKNEALHVIKNTCIKNIQVENRVLLISFCLRARASCQLMSYDHFECVFFLTVLYCLFFRSFVYINHVYIAPKQLKSKNFFI